MEDLSLLSALENWSGRVSVQLAFEARGFLIHRAWQNRMIEFCGEHQADLLNRYWDEVAFETMRCAGKVRSEMRYFGIEPNYRSAFLDELFAARDFLEPPFQAPRSSDACLSISRKLGLMQNLEIAKQIS
jgi:hypothetical protein